MTNYSRSVLKSNGLHRPKIRLKKFGFSLKTVPANIAKKLPLGEECLIDCPSVSMVYCDFATQKVTKISFEDLQVNDKVVMCIRSSEMENFRSGGNEENALKVEQLQLYTQRPAE